MLFLPSESRSVYPYPYNRQYRMIFRADLPVLAELALNAGAGLIR